MHDTNGSRCLPVTRRLIKNKIRGQESCAGGHLIPLLTQVCFCEVTTTKILEFFTIYGWNLHRPMHIKGYPSAEIHAFFLPLAPFSPPLFSAAEGGRYRISEALRLFPRPCFQQVRKQGRGKRHGSPLITKEKINC